MCGCLAAGPRAVFSRCLRLRSASDRVHNSPQGVPEGKGKFVTKLGRGELVYEGELMQVSALGVCDGARASAGAPLPRAFERRLTRASAARRR